MRKLALLVLALCLLFSFSAVYAAQDASDRIGSPLVTLLSLVPADALQSMTTIAFSDFRAAAEARPAAGVYERYDDWLAGYQSDAEGDAELAARVYAANFPGAGFLNVAQSLLMLSEMPQLVGFDLMDIDAALTFGMPPSQVMILSGRFDSAQIIAAHEARGYTLAEQTGALTILCPQAGCETGSQIDPTNRSRGNIFGGDLGREWPVAVSTDGRVWSSPDYAQVQAVASVYLGGQPSLAESDDVMTVISALYTSGSLIRQAVFLNPLEVLAAPGDPLALLPFDATGADVEAALEALRQQSADADSLPPYRLLTLGDTVTPGEAQHAVVAMAYADPEEAGAAAVILSERIDRLDSQVARRPLRDLLIEDPQAAFETQITETETGIGLNLVFSTALPADTPDDFGMVPQSAVLFSRLYNMVFARDLGWLAAQVSMPE